MNATIVAVDTMGGDLGPPVVINGALDALNHSAELKLILVGDEKIISSCLTSVSPAVLARVEIYPTSEIVTMDELPSHALRHKSKSSMRLALKCVASGRAQACVSTGNTGALVGMARAELNRLPGISRPILMSQLPKKEGSVYLLDLGANIAPSVDELVQYARLGHAILHNIHDYTAPRIGLLNIGVESIKGSETLHQVDRQLAALEYLNYVGFVEGDAIFLGDCDLIVCDGFSGNVILKASEGLAKMLGYYLETEFSRNIFAKAIKCFTKPIWKRFYSHINPDRYNGASLLGLEGIVIKSHGKANSFAVTHAILRAVTEVNKHMIDRIKYTLLEQEGQ